MGLELSEATDSSLRLAALLGRDGAIDGRVEASS